MTELNGEGKGRHFPLGGYRDLAEQWRQANLQGCPREVRLLLAAPHCSDLDFVNSLPTVGSQLDALGLCSSSCLAALRDYCLNRNRWFEDIANHHSIPPCTPTGMTKEEAVKALPIRLVHGGNYGEWAKDAGVADAGASNGAGLRCITELCRQTRRQTRTTVDHGH